MAVSAPVLEPGQAAPARSPKYTASLSSAEAVSQARLLKVLADPIRLQILSLLSRYAGEICVFDLVESFPLQQPTISHHLRLLRDAGLLDCQKKGIYAYYSVQPERIATARHALEQLSARTDASQG